jgi:hypothetical protein
LQELLENKRHYEDSAEIMRAAFSGRVQPIEWLSAFRHGVYPIECPIGAPVDVVMPRRIEALISTINTGSEFTYP